MTAKWWAWGAWLGPPGWEHAGNENELPRALPTDSVSYRDHVQDEVLRLAADDPRVVCRISRRLSSLRGRRSLV
jgi:hypothetical protein